jgi:hypothetical protein
MTSPFKNSGAYLFTVKADMVKTHIKERIWYLFLIKLFVIFWFITGVVKYIN